jgi:hypothetical protein
VQRSDLGVSLGGPIAGDRAFFFLAVDHQRDRTALIAPEGFPLHELGDVDRKREVTSYAAKATVIASVNHRFDLSLFGDPGKGEMGPQSDESLLYPNTAAFSALDYGGHNQSLRYHGILADSWLIEASAARAQSDFLETPSLDEWQLIDETTSPPTYSGGKGRTAGDNEGENLQFQIKSTHLIGRHDVRYGASLEDVDYVSVSKSTGPPLTLPDGLQTASGVRIAAIADDTFGKIYRVRRTSLTPRRLSNQRYLGLFAQDKLFLSERLTISAGIRYERQELIGRANDVTFDDNWAPRLGVVYDPGGAGRMKLFGSYGLFFARIPNDLPRLLFGGGGRVLWADYFDAELTQWVPDGVEALGTTRHYVTTSGSPAQVDPDAKSTYIQEAVAGFEYQPLPQLNVGVRYLYRDMPRVLEDLGTAAVVLYYTGGSDDRETYIGNPRDGHPPTVNGVGSFEDPIHRYRAVELTARKRFSNRWSLVGSYRWSHLEGNYEGFVRNDNGQTGPAISSLFDYPTDDPSYTAIGVPQFGFRGDIRYLGELGAGPLPNDREHQLKLHGAYTFDVGLSLGGGLWASTGRPLTPFAADPVLGRAGDIPEAPRGTGIETEDGFKKRTATTWSLDIHADYQLSVGRGRVVLAVDVFNLFDTGDPVDYDQNTERRPQVLNPDFGSRIAYQEPRRVRLGVRYEF